VVREAAFNERYQRGVGNESGAVDDCIEGPEPFVKNFDLLLRVRGVRKIALLKRKSRTLNVCGRPQVEPADSPTLFDEFVDEICPNLSGDSSDENQTVRH
jgi:hypothetical protein